MEEFYAMQCDIYIKINDAHGATKIKAVFI